MLRNYLITYPRSGVNWTIKRIRALIDLAGDDLWPKKRGRFIRMNHLGFAPEYPVGGKEISLEPEKDRKVFTVLRNAKQTLTSNWYFIQAHTRVRRLVSQRNPEAVDDLNVFLKSPEATEKYANFLAKMNEFKEEGRLEVYYYEDIQDSSFIYEIPKILGVEYEVSKEMAEEAHQNSNAVVNTFGTDHTAPSQEALQFVQERLTEICMLDEYRDRYL